MDIRQRKNLILLNHPLLKHKITLLRSKDTGTVLFRELVKEIAIMEGYEALNDLPLHEVDVVTPIEKAREPAIASDGLCFVPVLRAGLGMVEGFLTLVPTAQVGQIGLRRDEKSHKPIEYLCKLPASIGKTRVYVLDPMLATGGSAIKAVSLLKERGATDIRFVSIIAAPEGVASLLDKEPDVKLYVGALDRELNGNAYICPGLGDAGDRLFGTDKE